jgi:hypothetical protein
MSIEKLRVDLPDMPEEVIEGWLMTHYGRFGWPPRVDNDWRYVLRPGNDLGYLQKLRWQKKLFHLSVDALSSQDQGIIVELFRAHVLNETNAYSMMMRDGKERFERCLAYLKANGAFPKPPILQTNSQGYWILDGNHRLTAYFFLYGYFKTNIDGMPDMNVNEMQEFWVGT